MRVLIFDYSGHPFQVQLSRELAGQGLEVLHVYSSSFQSPKGNLKKTKDDPSCFDIHGISNSKPFKKQSFLRRRFQEVELGRVLAAKIMAWRPDVVVSSNAPLDVQRFAKRASRKCGATFVFWLQDIYSHAISNVLSDRLPFVGKLIGRYYESLEFHLLRESDAVIAITEDFRPILIEKGVESERITVIENWAPLDEIESLPRDNSWSRNEMPDGIRFIYSGTIGYKHNPDLLLQLARSIPHANVVVFSEGAIADSIRDTAIAERLGNFEVRPWVPFSTLPYALGSADIVIALIEPEAGIYSVPSKVLTYLTVGRPILASVPAVNLAARIIERVGAGIVAEPGHDDVFIMGGKQLAEDFDRRVAMGNAGREYAIETFDIANIAQRFKSAIFKPR